MEETNLVCQFIRGEVDASAIRDMFVDRDRASAGFDPETDLERIGVANQTTMLASESLAIASRLGEAVTDRFGPDGALERFRSFDTICSATQDRQDAVADMMKAPPDVMIVVGGFNSSNTNHLAALCARSTCTFHIESAMGIDVETGVLTYKPAGTQEVEAAERWLPDGPVEIGLTAGASTPDSLIGETAENILRMAGIDPADIGVTAGGETA